MSGIMSATGEPDRAPVRVGPSLIDMGTGMYVVIGVLDALRTRDRTGQGTSDWTSICSNRRSPGCHKVSRDTVKLVLFRRAPAQHWQPSHPIRFSMVATALIFIGASTQRFWERLCDALGLQHLLADQPVLGYACTGREPGRADGDHRSFACRAIER